MNLHRLLSRADDQSLQTLLGRSVLKLITILDPALTSPSKLVDLIFDLYTPQGLLADRQTREVLIDLLRLKEIEQLTSILDTTAQPDIYDQIKRRRFRQGSATEAAFYNYFELPPPIEEKFEETPGCRDGKTGYGLFKHQRDAARKIQKILAGDLPLRVVLHMPTGAGKTRTAMNIICEHLREREPGFVVWLAFSEELCEQAATEFEKAWQHLGNRTVDVFRFWGNRNYQPAIEQDGILIAGLAKMYSSVRRSMEFLSALGNQTTLVIIDEAHSAIAETYSLLLNALVVQHPRTGLLGLTATPGRTWADIDADEELARFFARKKVTLEIEGYGNPVNYLIDKGYLSQVRFKPLLHEGGTEISETDLEKIKRSFDIPDDVLVRLANDYLRNLAIVNEVERLIKTHKRVIVFAATVEHSNLLAAVLRAREVVADSITSATNTIDRTRIIEAYKQAGDSVHVLCNFGVLTTGFDAPQTSAALIARPTKSLVLYSQMVGRAIRGPKAGGNAIAEIVTVIDQELPGFGDVADAFENWEDVWE